MTFAKYHVLDLQAAPRMSTGEARERLSSGWCLMRLPAGLEYAGSPGGGLHSHAMLAANGRLAQISDSCVAQLDDPSLDLNALPLLDITDARIYLDPDSDEIEKMKRLGAIWDPRARRWCTKCNSTSSLGAGD